MTIQEILLQHQISDDLNCECGYNYDRHNPNEETFEVIYTTHQAEVLDKHMHEQALQAQMNVLNGVASAWEEMDGPGPTRIYARMLRETAQRINKEAHDA